MRLQAVPLLSAVGGVLLAFLYLYAVAAVQMFTNVYHNICMGPDPISNYTVNVTEARARGMVSNRVRQSSWWGSHFMWWWWSPHVQCVTLCSSSPAATDHCPFLMCLQVDSLDMYGCTGETDASPARFWNSLRECPTNFTCEVRPLPGLARSACVHA